MSMRTAFNIPLIILSCIVFLVHSCYAEKAFDPLYQLLRAKRSKEWLGSSGNWESTGTDGPASPVHMSSQSGLKEADKIMILPGQPQVTFNQYSGYVTVDPKAGRALFYYFVEAPISPSTKPLLLWLNGGPGSSSFGNGAMLELGPFRVNSNGETLYANEYAWNKVANVLFLESPAGVGFSYSNTTSDYQKNGDKRTAEDSYAFLVNWLERFPEYKNRSFFISGESYAGHYVPQLAQTILRRNKSTKQTVINLRGIAIGNPLIDDETTLKGSYDFFWTHAMISDEVMADINSHCNFSNLDEISPTCNSLLDKADESIGDIYIYNIYAPFCRTSSSAKQVKEGEQFDPCSQMYVKMYLNHPQVQSALHANVTALPFPWTARSSVIDRWNDAPTTVIPIIQELMASGISVWIYSGDIDGRIPVTSTRYSIKRFATSIETPWYPWYSQGEVGGYAVGYRNMTFVTVRGAGHLVPSYQPARALTLVSSFLEGKLPPTS